MALPAAQFPYTARRVYDILRTEREAMGLVHRRARHPHEIREWEIVWPLLTDTQASDIRTEIGTTKGGAGTFSWTNPDGASVTAWFLEPPELQRIAVGWWSGRAIIREEFI